MSRKYFDFFFKVLHTASAKNIDSNFEHSRFFNIHIFRYHLQTHENKFCKLILIGSTRCSLSKCYLVLACNFDRLKACLQKKVRRAD